MVFSFGSHMVAHEVKERFKLTNPFKVPCTVVLTVGARGAKCLTGGKGEPLGELCFDVQPDTVTIPPHEHRYVTVCFTPAAMQSYSAIFGASVEMGTVAETRRLSFELLAEGTLPHVTIVAPSARLVEGAPLLSFPKLLVGRTSRLPLTLHNEGVLPATVSVSKVISESDGGCMAFSCIACGQSIMLPPGTSQTIDVLFKPTTDGERTAAISLSVQQNPFEDVTIALRAQGAIQQVAFEDLPPVLEMPAEAPTSGEDFDCLNFGDTEVGVPKAITFSLRSFSEFTRKFTWSCVEGVTFSPSVGHLLPHGVKSITATLLTKIPLLHEATEASLSMVQIACPEGGSRVEWDNSMRVLRYLTDDEFKEREAAAIAGGAETTNSSQAEAAPLAAEVIDGLEPPSPSVASPRRVRHKVIDVDAEPAHDVVEPSEGEASEPLLKLSVAAKCDYADIGCETTSLAFRPTMMFQVRSHTFVLVNKGAVALDYRWKVTATDGSTSTFSATEVPFTASPSHGTIPAGEAQNVTVSFSPAEVDSFARLLTCVTSNLAPGTVTPMIMLTGRSQRPYCHFELVESNYVRAGRRSPEMPGPDGSLGPLDALTKVVEFSSLGTRVRNTKRFYVVNPTNRTYEFFWEPQSDLSYMTAEALGAQPFRCQTRKGVVLAGRKFEMVVHFTPEAVELQESFWRFKVPELSIDVPFLFVGTILEPGVALDCTRHNFGPLLIGQRAREIVHIVNTEHLPFSFVFERASFAAGPIGADSVVGVSPHSGVVGPDSRLPVELTFAPTLEKHFNFNLELKIKSKPQPLVLNVKGEGYAIHDTLQLQDAVGKLVEISPHAATRVDFGEVHINDKVIRQIQVINSGRFNFDFALALKMPPGARMPPVAVTPELATVAKNERLNCQLAYSPTSDAPLPPGLQLVCAVTNGRTYNLQLVGRGKRPKLLFAFMKHDFGPCFVVTPKNGLSPAIAQLQLLNEDEGEVYFDMPFDESPFLSASVDRTTLAPGEHATVLLSFAPPTAGRFVATLPFLVNGLWSQSVEVVGEGCELRLELVDPTQQQLAFGSVPLHQQAMRTVAVINRSRRPVEVCLAAAAAMLARYSVAIAFSGGGVEGVLRPRESRGIELRFAPSTRITPFSEPVVATVCGLPRPLLVLSAACVAMEMELEMEQVSFGQATLYSRITRPVMLQNRGDLPSSFRLDRSRLAPDFSISPLEGYLQPNEDTNLEVTFHPQHVNRDIRYERIPVYVDGQSPLSLTLTGMCVEATAELTPLVFITCVRESAAQTILVKNPSSGPWRIHPLVTNEQWSGAEVLEVPPGSSAAYEVTYCPMAMTRLSEDGAEKHFGSVFFPLSDGSAILYSLEGVAEPPNAAGNITQTYECKQQHILPLEIANWLKTPQRFKVDIRAPTLDDATVLSGHEHIDVPAGLTREYALSFFAHKEGTTNAEVHFINEKSGEYLFFKITLKAQAAGVLRLISMQAPLRQLSRHTLPLTNPLEVPVTFAASINNAEVAVPSAFTVEAKKKAELTIEWRPLLPRELVSQLSLTSAELGTFLYDLKLCALDAGEAKTLVFKSALGDSQTLRFRFTNFLKRVENFKVTLGSSGDFECDANVSAPAAEDSSGAEAAVDVTFEPSTMGESHDTLTVSSAEGGEYSCSLIGSALAPKPQGPIMIKAGGSAHVTFKNVFLSSGDFSFLCEPAAFKVGKQTDSVPAKKTTQITVTYTPEPEAPEGVPPSGKLTVSGPHGFTQLYYLSGTA